MSTPIRPIECRKNRVIREKMEKFSMKEAVRFSPMTRCGPKPSTSSGDATKCPRSRKIRQSRLKIIPENSPTTPSRIHLPIPRLLFENEDFLKQYNGDAVEEAKNPNSMDYLADILIRTLLKKDSPKNSTNNKKSPLIVVKKLKN